MERSLTFTGLSLCSSGSEENRSVAELLTILEYVRLKCGDITGNAQTIRDAFEEILKDLNLDEPDVTSSPTQYFQPAISSAQISEWIVLILDDVGSGFSFFEAAKDLKDAPKEVSTALEKLICRCLVKKSNIAGVNREASQRAFFGLAADGMTEVTALTGNHQLSMWRALQLFNKSLDLQFSDFHGDIPGTLVGSITSEEMDIAHYIGGAVISKLQRRSKGGEKEVLAQLVSDEPPQDGTLLQAKSRGKLRNLTADAKCLFVEVEQVYRDTFPCITENVNEGDFEAACYKNSVIQDCFFTSVYALDNINDEEKVLANILHLYFKIRIHHKCKIILDTVRAKSKVSSKDRALRAKLSK